MAKVTLEDAKRVSDQLVADLHPRAVILFGSVARQGVGNDLDLLIIKDENNKTKWESYLEVNRCLKPFLNRFWIDFFVAPESIVKELFLEGSPFLRLIQREGKSLYMRDSVKEWFKHAREDLAMAEVLYKNGFYRGTCYFGQQALEKTMKGLLIQKHWELEKIHSIGKLITYGEMHGLSFTIPEKTIALIDSLYRGRYPGEEGLLPTGEPTQEHADCILDATRNFLSQWLKPEA